ncbi:MAG: Bacterial alpha-L-rhamnosidase, partial [Candidatus Marinimicrobia bacterium]|nr:Bacterial alpha-L-rhamnosidase [Candidatus Neomarinimicrobiota bacterium]
MYSMKQTRRSFLRNFSLGSGALIVGTGTVSGQDTASNLTEFQHPEHDESHIRILDLSPAQWIWYPSERTLQNTMLLFRREFHLSGAPEHAVGYIHGDSRYLLFVNGKRVQWGPAPSDPRWVEVDPIDISDYLVPGKNVIGAQVLFYGEGDGTWPIGNPGFIFTCDITASEKTTKILSDESWQVHLARAWKPGQYKRWFLRAFQEEFDARLYPHGWTLPDFTPDDSWLEPMQLPCPADKPTACSYYSNYKFGGIRLDPSIGRLEERSIPALDENSLSVNELAEAYQLSWNRPVAEYFEYRTPEAFSAKSFTAISTSGENAWMLTAQSEKAYAFTFAFEDQIVGWPYFTIEAPEGTVIEMMVHEAHEVGGPVLLNTHFNAWARFTCVEGKNRFEAFDYESLRWIQLHVHNAEGPVKISDIGVRRRRYPWPADAQIECDDPNLQRLFDATVNTLHNSAQDIIVDGMGRERQQYSGDCGHQLHAIYLAFGEKRQPARYIKTFSQGLTEDGFFLDSWPAYDRLARLFERQMQLTQWGPLLDHGIGFVFDNYYHWMYTGQLDDLRESYPRLLTFVNYLKSLIDKHGLLPVEDIGIPTVWIDHDAYQQQRHKQCAFNLYASAMLTHALAPLCEAFRQPDNATEARKFGELLLNNSIQRFWSSEEGIFIINKPWLSQDNGPRLCDRSLATAVLYDQCPEGRVQPAVDALTDVPANMGLSYPANAGWRLWALGEAGRTDVILNDFRTRWATMSSVIQNNTLQEAWHAEPDSGSQWSHCPVAPVYVTYMSLLGIKPLEPGFKRYEIKPQLADLESLDIMSRMPGSGIHVVSRGAKGDRSMTIRTPAGYNGELVLDERERVSLPQTGSQPGDGFKRYQLPEDDHLEI